MTNGLEVIIGDRRVTIYLGYRDQPYKHLPAGWYYETLNGVALAQGCASPEEALASARVAIKEAR